MAESVTAFPYAQSCLYSTVHIIHVAARCQQSMNARMQAKKLSAYSLNNDYYSISVD